MRFMRLTIGPLALGVAALLAGCMSPPKPPAVHGELHPINSKARALSTIGLAS